MSGVVLFQGRLPRPARPAASAAGGRRGTAVRWPNSTALRLPQVTGCDGLVPAELMFTIVTSLLNA